MRLRTALVLIGVTAAVWVAGVGAAAWYVVRHYDRGAVRPADPAALAADPNDDAAACRTRLDKEPDNVECFTQLVYMLRPDQYAELGDRLKRMKAPETVFRSTALDFLYGGRIDGAAAFTEVYRDLRPDDAEGWCVAASVELRRQRPDEAAALLATAYEKAAPAQRTNIVGLFAGIAAKIDEWEEGYEIGSRFDRRTTYCTLAEWFTCQFHEHDELGDEPDRMAFLAKRVKVLTALHRRADPADYKTDMSDGMLAMREADYAAADAAFAAAEKKLPTAPPQIEALPASEQRIAIEQSGDRNSIQYDRVRAWYKLGKGIDAYKTFGPDHFEQLVRYFIEDGDADGLEKLLVIHPSKPYEKDRAIYSATVLWLRRDYAAAVEAYRTYCNRFAEIDGGGAPKLHRAEHVRDRLVRSLIRLKRVEEASVELQNFRIRGDAILDLLILAAKGDPQAMLEKLRTICGEDKDGGWLYDDEDLGPILKSDKFRPIRDEFPPPKPADSDGPAN